MVRESNVEFEWQDEHQSFGADGEGRDEYPDFFINEAAIRVVE